MTSNPLDELFELEETFYKEGYTLGVQDGSHQGRIEGRLFGLEKGFEKYITMGKLQGRSVIWSRRLPPSAHCSEAGSVGEKPAEFTSNQSTENSADTLESIHGKDTAFPLATSSSLPTLPHNLRLEKHLRTLYALTEPASLSTENNEDAVSDFDDRLRRAEGKVKIIEKLVGEESVIDGHQGALEVLSGSSSRRQAAGKGSEGIEDISIQQARR